MTRSSPHRLLFLSFTAACLGAAPGARSQTATPPAPVSPVTLVNQFEATGGKFEGYRRSGAKGVCATGEFTGTEAARALSSASVFSGKPVPVSARFSIGGGNPQAPDNAKSQRNMALVFDLPGGEQWIQGNINAPVFGSSSPQQLLDLLVSRQPDPATKAADPAKVKAFNDANPEVLLQGRYFASQPVPASFASVNYWGVHAYGFVNAGGSKQFGKWIYEPVDGVAGLTDDEVKSRGPTFLFADLRERAKAGKVAFNLNLELAEPGDKLDSATVPLPAGRKKVTLGTLRITSVSEDAGGACVTTNFNPMVMPKGIEPSADPMLAARAAPYVVSRGRRVIEGAKQ